MKALLGDTVFSVGDADYRWGDVVLAAEVWGDWARVQERAREGVACLTGLDEEEDRLSDEEIEAAAEDFRYARELISAEEMEEWLERWGLTTESWMDWVRCSILRRKSSGELARLVSESAPEEEAIESFLMTEAVCSGELERLAYKLAGRAAISQKEHASSILEGDGLDSTWKEKVERMERSFQAFRQRSVTAAAIDREIRLRSGEWTRLDCRRLDFSREEAAREAALCVREDGTALEDVAVSAGAEIASERFSIGELEPELQTSFPDARKGDLVGPVRRGESFAVYLVVDRIPPSEKDPGDVRLAEDAILERLVDREINDRVKWRAALGVGA